MKKYYCLVDGGCPSNGRNAWKMFGSYAIYETTELELEPTIPQLNYMEPVLHENRFPIMQTKATNNVAEVSSIVQLINTLKKLKFLVPENRVTICSDSQLVVKQITGEYSINKPHLKALYKSAFKLFDDFKKNHNVAVGEILKFKWISGEEMKDSIIGH